MDIFSLVGYPWALAMGIFILARYPWALAMDIFSLAGYPWPLTRVSFAWLVGRISVGQCSCYLQCFGASGCTSAAILQGPEGILHPLVGWISLGRAARLDKAATSIYEL